MRKRRVGIVEVAARAGVSATTVHFALHNTGRTSEATRQKVLQIARELDYHPHRLARGLRAQRSQILGVVVPGLRNPWVAHVVEGIEMAAAETDHGLLLACSYGDASTEGAAVEMLREQAVDGLVVIPTDPLGSSVHLRALAEEAYPLVLADWAIPGLEVPTVSVDNLKGGYVAGRHLARIGRKRIVFVTNVSWMRRWPVAEERLRGCNQALEEAGVAQATVVGPQIADVLPEERFGFEAVNRYLEAGGELDGLFAVNDVIACGALRALASQGLRVPRDVSVIGFDDQDLAPYLSPSLTTVHQPMREIGRQAVQLLVREIRMAEEPSFSRGSPRVQQVRLQPSLVVRESCGERTGLLTFI